MKRSGRGEGDLADLKGERRGWRNRSVARQDSEALDL